jgi:enoyl-CoA hydratase
MGRALIPVTQSIVASQEPVVRFEEKDAIAVVTINRPKALNALSPDVVAELESTFSKIAQSPAIRGVILTGAGDKSFIAGADIASMSRLSPIEARAWGQRGQQLLFKMENLGKPVIAAVNGYALGGGLEIAMACDFIVAAPEAKLGQPEVLLGVIPGFGGTQRLARLVGAAKAKQLCMTGEQITAEEGYRLGLVAELAPRADLLRRCEEILRKILQNGPVAVRLAKEVINRGVNMDLESAAALELAAFAICFSTDDQKEGMKAFLEKRKASFTGQ